MFSINKQQAELDAPQLFPYWIANHPETQKKIVLFWPSKDIDKNYASSISMPSQAYLLHTQAIAKYFIAKGYTCILPVTEYGSYEITGLQTITNALESICNVFAAASTSIQEEDIGRLARMHWVSVIWTPDQLEFFDPKASNIAHLVVYNNTLFKTFAERAGYSAAQYINEVEERDYPQALFDFNNFTHLLDYTIR